MITEVKPEESSRAAAFNLWMTSPMPMVLWGKYRKGLFKTTLALSFQFHHVQMDGGHGARFLEELQKAVRE